MRYRQCFVAAVLVMHALASLLFAEEASIPGRVVFSNIVGTSTPGGYVIGLYPFPPPTSESFADAEPFTPTGSNYRLTGVKVLASLAHGVNDVLITLYTDSNGVPDTPLESWSIVNVLGSAPVIVPARSLLHPTLKVGRQYWLVVTMAVPSSEGIWWGNPIGDVRLQAASISGGPYSVLPLLAGAFEIRGTRIDENGEDLD